MCHDSEGHSEWTCWSRRWRSAVCPCLTEINTSACSLTRITLQGFDDEEDDDEDDKVISLPPPTSPLGSSIRVFACEAKIYCASCLSTFFVSSSFHVSCRTNDRNRLCYPMFKVGGPGSVMGNDSSWCVKNSSFCAQLRLLQTGGVDKRLQQMTSTHLDNHSTPAVFTPNLPALTEGGGYGSVMRKEE